MKRINQETMDKILKAADKARVNGINVKLDFRGCDLQGLHLWGANLKGADVWGANLRGAILKYTNLEGANLAFSDLQRANLLCANLQGANLGYANLQGANLKGVNLSWAYLGYAKLYDAKLVGADLGGADLDFSVFRPLRKDRNIKVDDIPTNQLLRCVADIMNASGRETPSQTKKTTNQSHLIEECKFEKV